MKITVKVTGWHIRHGELERCSKCPIALALQDALKEQYPAADHKSGQIYPSRAYFHASPAGEVLDFTAILPMNAMNFVCDFDNGRKVKPLTFELDFPTIQE